MLLVVLGGDADLLMDVEEVVGALAIGFAAGWSGGMLGVGGGILFVPALAIFLGQSQLGAEATSLWHHARVAWWARGASTATATSACATGWSSGCCRPLGVVAGAVLANAVSERALGARVRRRPALVRLQPRRPAGLPSMRVTR